MLDERGAVWTIRPVCRRCDGRTRQRGRVRLVRQQPRRLVVLWQTHDLLVDWRAAIDRSKPQVAHPITRSNRRNVALACDAIGFAVLDHLVHVFGVAHGYSYLGSIGKKGATLHFTKNPVGLAHAHGRIQNAHGAHVITTIGWLVPLVASD